MTATRGSIAASGVCWLPMHVRAGAGVSMQPDARVAAIEAAAAARAGLDGAPADLAVVFASGVHMFSPEATLEGVHEALLPRRVLGCGAGGILGEGRELERGNGIAVWAVSLFGGEAQTFHSHAVEGEHETSVEGLPAVGPGDALLLLPDVHTYPTDGLLAGLADAAPGVPVVGGLSSGRDPEGAAVLFLDEQVLREGAVGARFAGIDMLPCVSQGAAPIGPEMT